MRIIFILPAYNEEKNIGTLLNSIHSKMTETDTVYSMFIINDGSIDRTRRIAEEMKNRMPITLIDHLKNRGVGEVFRTGFNSIMKTLKDEDMVVTMEADNTSDLDILPEMLKKIKNDGYNLVLASCYAKGGRVVGTTFSRMTMSAWANFFLRLLFPIKGVKTYSSFYRVYTGELIKKANTVYGQNMIREKGFACMVELLIKLHRIGAKITEVPMVLKCHFRKGNSKMKVLRTIIAYLKIYLRGVSR